MQRIPFLPALLSLAFSASMAHAQGYPSAPITLVVPFAAGSGTDSVARAVGQKLSDRLKQPVVIDNKPGGSYAVGMSVMAGAPADGYTLLAVNVSMASTQVTLKKFDLLKSLAPVGRIAETPAMLLVSGKSAYKSVGELVAQAKANPGRLNMAS